LQVRQGPKLLDRKGVLWQEECFDHVVRSAKYLVKYEDYIARHVKQGALVETRALI
jgi:hypothetical protein